MGETANYGLYVTDSEQENFLDWRTKMNGTTGSNMTKIDEILAGKARKSTKQELTLLASGWVGDTKPYRYELLIDNLTRDQDGFLSEAHGLTEEQREAVRRAGMTIEGQDDGKLVIVADGNVPEVDITVVLTFTD